MRTSIIIPTLNEVENIDPLLARVFTVLEKNDVDADVLVADGGSTDGTVEAVQEWEKTRPVTLIRSDGSRGLSGDVMHAAGQTGAEVLVVMDADLSHRPESLPDLIRPILDGTHDMVIGSRYVKGGKVPGWPWHRRLFSRAATLLAWPLVSVRDPMSGFFAVQRAILVKHGRFSDGYKIGLEVMVRSGDSLRVKEVPIIFTDREKGASKLGSKVILDYFTQIVSLAGGMTLKGQGKRLAAVALTGVFVDVAIFNLLYSMGLNTTVSQFSSFTAAAVTVYLLVGRGKEPDSNPSATGSSIFLHLRFLLICVLALFLRTAKITALIRLSGFPVRLAHLGGTAAAAAVLSVGILFFLFRPAGGKERTAGIRWRVLALAAAAYSLSLRVLYSGIIDLIPEEAYYWNYGQHPDLGYLDHPPVVGWLNFLSTGLFGNSEAAVRSSAILCWCLMVFFTYRLTRNLFDKTAALAAVLMVCVLPIYLGTGLFMMPDPPLYAAWAGSLYFLSRALVDSRHRAWIGVGFCLGVGMLSKYTIALLVPATLIFVLIHIRGRTRSTLMRPELYIGAALSFLIFLPVIIWNAEHDWVSFAFQGARRWSNPSFSFHILLINMLIVITPLGVAAAFRILFPGKGRLREVLRDIDPEGVNLSFARVYTLFPLGVFALHSFQGLSKFNWTGPVWLAVFPLLGGAVSRFSRREEERPPNAKSFSFLSWQRNSAGCLLLFGGLLFYIVMGMPGATPIRGMVLPLAWHEMAREVDAIPMRDNARGKPLVVGLEDYWIASEYSFYRNKARGKEPAGRHIVDRNSLMWSYWLDKKEAAGRDVILIDFERSGLGDKRLEKYFEKMDGINEMPLRRNGRTAALVYYRKGFSYKPDP